MRVALAVLLLLVGPAVDGARAETESVTDLVARLGAADSDSSVAYSAYLELSRRVDERIPALVAAGIETWKPYAQSYGMMLIERGVGRTVKPILKRLTRSSDPFLKVAAAARLLILGEKGMSRVIAGVLRDDAVTPATKLRFLYRLSGVKDELVLVELRRALVPGGDANYVGAVLWALHRAQDVDAVPAVVALAAEEEDHQVVIQALAFIEAREGGRDEEIGALIADGSISYSTFMRVRNYLWTNAGPTKKMADGIVELIRKVESTNTAYASFALGILAKAHRVEGVPVMKELLDHENETLARAAFDGLAAFPGALDTDELRVLLRAGMLDRRLWAADALRRRDDRSGLPVALAVLAEDHTLRKSALDVLAKFRCEEVVEPLIDALGDDDAAVRQVAYTGVALALRTLYPYRRFEFENPYGANAEERAALVVRLEEWWKANRGKPW